MTPAPFVSVCFGSVPLSSVLIPYGSVKKASFGSVLVRSTFGSGSVLVRFCLVLALFLFSSGSAEECQTLLMLICSLTWTGSAQRFSARLG